MIIRRLVERVSSDKLYQVTCDLIEVPLRSLRSTDLHTDLDFVHCFCLL